MIVTITSAGKNEFSKCVGKRSVSKADQFRLHEQVYVTLGCQPWWWCPSCPRLELSGGSSQEDFRQFKCQLDQYIRADNETDEVRFRDQLPLYV